MPRATAISSRFSLVRATLLRDSMPSPMTTGFTSSALMTSVENALFTPPNTVRHQSRSVLRSAWRVVAGTANRVALIAPRSKKLVVNFSMLPRTWAAFRAARTGDQVGGPNSIAGSGSQKWITSSGASEICWLPRSLVNPCNPSGVRSGLIVVGAR